MKKTYFIIFITISIVILFIIKSRSVIHLENAKPEYGKSEKNEHSQNSGKILKIGRTPSSNAADLIKKYEPLRTYLKEKLCFKDVIIMIPRDYHGAINQLEHGETDIAWLTTASYAENSEKSNLIPMVRPMRNNSEYYRGMIITGRASGIKNLQELRGKKFLWVDRESASGFILPRALMSKNGLDPRTSFEESTYTGTHDRVVLNVFLKNFDAGACHENAVNILEDKEKIEKISIISYTDPIINEPIVYKKGEIKKTAEAVKKALIELDPSNNEHKKILDGIEVQKFIPASDKDYDGIRETIKNVRNLK
ncbi:MAG: phosphate/phosphite/phosphonate ABC transporter substrate-binding protein [Candidatus Wallbacteria bacterium]